MATEDEILAALEEDASKLKPTVTALEYAVPLSDEDYGDVIEKWEHIAGVLYRQGARDVDLYDKSEGQRMMFTLDVGVDIAKVMLALQEEVDEATGRKAVEEAGESWGLF